MSEVIDDQLIENNPPITIVTLNRLVKTGDTEEQAKEKVAAAVAVHVYEITKHAFDEELYINDLSEQE